VKVALLGYGKMGQEIESILKDRGHTVVARIDSQHRISTLTECDVAIDFSTPTVVLSHIRWCMEHNIPLVVGTTGWHDNIEEVKDWVRANNGSMIHASNFSLGVYVFRQANKLLANALGSQEVYKMSLREAHHTEKLDAPSGTAISIAEDMIDQAGALKQWELSENGNEGTLPIKAERIAGETGTHQVTYRSEIDEINLEHKAHSRKGFALGAVVAAEWITSHKGLFGIGDMLKI
jgi:4-hydroxy-tetrahydrodipicolinate reductase